MVPVPFYRGTFFLHKIYTNTFLSLIPTPNPNINLNLSSTLILSPALFPIPIPTPNPNINLNLSPTLILSPALFPIPVRVDRGGENVIVKFQ